MSFICIKFLQFHNFILLFIQIKLKAYKIKIMITRRQSRRQVESSPQVNVKTKQKKTKAQILKEKDNKKQQPKGNKVAAKKVKEDQKPKSVPKEPQNKKKKDNKQVQRVQTKKQKEQAKKRQESKDAKKTKEASKARTQKQRSKSPERKKPQPIVAKQEPKQNVKKIIMKGKVPIDDYFTLDKAKFHVLEHQGKVFSATLNQTNVSNNNNKFYIIQVLQSDDNANNNYFFCRWGRVGVPGQVSCAGPMSVMAAVINFNSKYRQKHDKGDYRQVDLNYGDDEEDKANETKQDDKPKDQNKPQVESKLQKPVKDLINLIFDINMMNRQMKEIGYNVDKMPLGKLSKENIKKGFGILNDLLDQLTKKKRRDKIQDLTNDFYSYIPHDFGFKKMSNFILDTEQLVKKKISMLEALSQIKVATNLLSESKVSENVIDSNYAKLNRDIINISPSTTEYETIKKYLLTTHGKHHSNYTLELVDLFKINDQRENVRYTKDIPNKMLLWHGSRLTNFVGILSQGLRIAPPQAPVTGYMFGKGVYFADMSSKSANYCATSIDNPTGILLLCEVALGDMNEKENADYYASNLPPGKSSTKGMGKIVPDPKNSISLQEGVTIPMGPSIELDQNFRLRYNEFIVYDVAQIKIKYLLRTKFNYVQKQGGFW